MTTFSWLHLTDLHCGMSEQKHLWPNIRGTFINDLHTMHKTSGPWNIVFFTGDLVQRGEASEFNKLNEIFDELWEIFNKLGSNPLLIPIPGNHDLMRPDEKAPAVRLLSKWGNNPEIHEEFWNDQNSEYRSVVKMAFSNYMDWFERNPLIPSSKTNRGMLPGDISISLKLDNIALGVVGLNSAFLQLTGGNYSGQLVLNTRQFHDACNGDGVQWVGQHNTSIILTHHPRHWLNPNSLEKDFAEIAPAGRFAAHMFGHMHESQMHNESVGGGPTQRSLQGCSLFGLEHYGLGNDEIRSHGYSSGQIEFTEQAGSMRIWPRIAQWHKVNGWRIIPDNIHYVLKEDGATAPEIFGLSMPASKPTPTEQVVELSTPLTSQSLEEGIHTVQIHHIPFQTYGSDLRPVVDVWVGREDELAALSKLNNGVAVITGIGGQGKTALVAKFLEGWISDHPKSFWDWRDCREEGERFLSQLVSLIEHWSEGG